MINYFLGTIEINVFDLKSITLLSKENIQCFDIVGDKESLIFKIPLFKYKQMKSVFEREKISYKINGIYGFPGLAYKYRKRYGLFIGVFIFILILNISDNYIWSFTIEGNDNIDDSIILTTLDNLGCRIGSKIDEMDFDVLHNKFLIECSDISWISINMNGTKANVQVRETIRGSSGTNEKYNIVANEDAQIYSISVVEGKEQVVIGDVVKKGDILISGVESYREGEKNYYGSANGKVLAIVNKRINVEIHEDTLHKTYTEKFVTQRKINFFGFNINLSVNSSIPYEKYDIITENRQVVLFERIELPIWFETVRFNEYIEQTIKMTEEEIRVIAVKKFKEEMSYYSTNYELVSTETMHSFVDGVYKIECNLYCITDISEKVPYSIDKNSQEEK